MITASAPAGAGSLTMMTASPASARARPIKACRRSSSIPSKKHAASTARKPEKVNGMRRPSTNEIAAAPMIIEAGAANGNRLRTSSTSVSATSIATATGMGRVGAFGSSPETAISSAPATAKATMKASGQYSRMSRHTRVVIRSKYACLFDPASAAKTNSASSLRRTAASASTLFSAFSGR
jgi:hypothetical protein